LVVAATPEVHGEVVSRSLRRELPVFVERPPAPDLQALEARWRVGFQSAPTGEELRHRQTSLVLHFVARQG
jgi:hypothetical protein